MQTFKGVTRMLDQITPVILTHDELPNIDRTFERLTWAKEIVVVDSGSTDGTIEAVLRYPNVRVFKREFTTHAEQWSFGLLETEISTEWVLALDADYVLSSELLDEIACLPDSTDVMGYEVSFRYCIDGTPLRGTTYPPCIVLYRRRAATYFQDGHTQRVRVAGRIASLRGKIFHDDRKPLARWISAQAKYMHLEAEKLSKASSCRLGVADKVRKLIVVAPIAVFLYCAFVKRNILDGRAGMYYALQRATAEAILSLYLLQHRLRAPRTQEPS